MNIIKASIFSLLFKVLQRISLAKFHLSSDPIVNVWASLTQKKIFCPLWTYFIEIPSEWIHLQLFLIKYCNCHKKLKFNVASNILTCYVTHVLVHLVKSACLYSVNPFSTLFSANIQHNCPILFGICPTYLPAGLAFRFSFQKQLHLHFQGKWPLAPSSFERMSYSHRSFLQNIKWNQLVSPLLCLILFGSSFLNSADFSYNCTPSSCSISFSFSSSALTQAKIW